MSVETTEAQSGDPGLDRLRELLEPVPALDMTPLEMQQEMARLNGLLADQQRINDDLRDGRAKAMQLYYQAQEETQKAKDEHRLHLVRISKRLHQLAEEQDWCESFDDEMEQYGLERRDHKVRTRAQVTVRFDVTIEETTTLPTEEYLRRFQGDDPFRSAVHDVINTYQSGETEVDYEIVEVENIEEVDE